MLLSPNLSLDYIDVNAAQREVTHNAAIRALDALVQLAVLDRDLATPPSSPSDGQRWIVAATPTGAWTGKATQITAWQDGAWRFYVPRLGWLVYVIDEGKLVAWSGSAWVDALSMLTTLQNLALLGVGTTADATNPFSAKLNNALWVAKTVAEGGDGNLRYKLSKESAAKTLSLLMQTNFSGRAEIGLTGDDDLHLKVSSDGSTWIDAIKVAGASGAVAITAANALALAVGRQGATNPALWVDASAASCVTGLSVTAKAAGSRLLLAVGSTGTDEGLSIDARGAGTVRLGATSTGAIEFSRNAVPTASDGAALGTTALMWSDLFLASGAVVNFNSGNYTLTHSSTQLAASGRFAVGTASPLGYTFEVKSATDEHFIVTGHSNLANGIVIKSVRDADDATFKGMEFIAASYLFSSGGVVLSTATGGDKGVGTINAVAVYDDNVLLTCFGVEYLIDGRIDLAKWDRYSRSGRNALVHRFAAMIDGGFDPRDPKRYIHKMYDDRALPGMPTEADWRHNALSLGELHNRLWLATELLASAFVGSHNDHERRLAALESSLNSFRSN